jgi:hypothetical protein
MRVWLVAIALAAGCGPVAYVHQVTLTADEAVESARRAHADKYSPYWWTRANEYLHMAREVAAHADYQGANRFGQLAAEAAGKAQEEAEIGAKDPSKLPYKDVKKNGGVAPAKEDSVAPAKEDSVTPAKETP